MAGVAKTPSSYKRCVNWKAFASLPIRIGTIGVWVLPILKPMRLNPSCILWVLRQRCSMRSGSCCMISRAFKTPPATEGASEAVKMKATGAMLEVLNHLGIARDEAAHGPERL